MQRQATSKRRSLSQRRCLGGKVCVRCTRRQKTTLLTIATLSSCGCTAILRNATSTTPRNYERCVFCACAHVRACMRACVRVRVCVCVCLRARVCVCVCACVRVSARAPFLVCLREHARLHDFAFVHLPCASLRNGPRCGTKCGK
jgi:hypothetical protein